MNSTLSPSEKKSDYLKRSGIPERYIETPVDVSLIPELARGWRTKDGNLLIFGEGTGNGKTTAAAYLAGLISQTATTFRFIQVPTLILRTRGTWNAARGEAAEDDILDDMLKPGVLILDDLGAEQLSQTSSAFLYAVLDGRWANNKKTIFTSNLTPEQIIQRYGDKIASRVLSGRQVEFTGSDKRVFKP